MGMLKPVERVHCDRRIGIRDADGLEGRSGLLSLSLPVGLNYRKPRGVVRTTAVICSLLVLSIAGVFLALPLLAGGEKVRQRLERAGWTLR